MDRKQQDIIDFIQACCEALDGISPSRLARRAGLAPSTVNRVLNRKKPVKHLLSTRTLMKLADAAGIPLPLRLGISAQHRKARLIGYVGAGDQVLPTGDENHFQPVDAPPGLTNGAAVRVRGDSMWPAYRDGEYLFFSHTENQPISESLRRDSIIQIHDGPLYCKRLEKGTKRGVYRLASYGAPDIEDVKVQWAVPIEWVKRVSGRGL